MPIHILTLLERQEVANHTIVLSFSKPDNFHFTPGQYGGFTLIEPKEVDKNGITRRFSLLSTPTDEHLQIVTRIQNSAYKKALSTMPIGSQIKFAGPTGVFTLHEDLSIPAVLIAGGIGIAPFYSMIRHRNAQHSSQSIILFYGNQSEKDAAFLPNLLQLSQQNTNFKCITTLAEPHDAWQGETGFITHTMIKKYIVDLHTPIFYICGSPAMVTVLQETLVEMGISEQKIKVEDFPGY